MNREDLRILLEPAIAVQLDEIAESNHCGAGAIVKSVERSELRVRLASVDRLACEVELVSVTNPCFGCMSTDELSSVADELSESMSYLEERLIVLEVDPVLANVQMRSQVAHVEEDVRSYFEVHVGKLGVTLQRFEKQPGNQRQSVPAAMTRGIFLRACTDLLGAASV